MAETAIALGLPVFGLSDALASMLAESPLFLTGGTGLQAVFSD